MSHCCGRCKDGGGHNVGRDQGKDALWIMVAHYNDACTQAMGPTSQCMGAYAGILDINVCKVRILAKHGATDS